jgi:hypothetical protein
MRRDVKKDLTKAVFRFLGLLHTEIKKKKGEGCAASYSDEKYFFVFRFF